MQGAGYRFLSVDDYGGRASKYNYLHSGIVGGANYSRLGQDLKLSLDGDFLNSNDYYGDFKFDYAGDYRLHIRTDALYHNLEGEQLFGITPFKLGERNLYLIRRDSLVGYGLRTEQDSATMRYKIQDFPLHLNISYWRMIKEGTTPDSFCRHGL